MAKTYPSLRRKKRYIFFKVHSDGPAQYPDVRNSVINSMIQWLGEGDMAKADVSLVKNLWNAKGQNGVIRCSHKYVDEAKLAMALIHQIGDSRVAFQTLRVSGTLKAGKEKSNHSPKRAGRSMNPTS